MVVAIEKARPGMILLDDVLLSSGAVLVNATQVLTGEIIDTIAKRGIQKIQVVPDEAAPQSSQEAVKTHKREQSPAAPGISSPKLTVIVSDDAMSAKLSIEAAGGENETVTGDLIRAALEKEGIIIGIDEMKVSELVEKWNKKKRCCEADNIAAGIPAQPAKEGNFECCVRSIAGAEKLAIAKQTGFARDLAGKVNDAQRVDPGTVIAKKREDVPGVAGMTVRGDPVPVPGTLRSPISLDATVELSEDKKEIIAKATGMAFHVDNAIGVCPLKFDGSIELFVSPDKMKAQAWFHAPGERGSPPSARQIESLLQENRIVYGIRDNEIGAVLTACAAGRYPLEPVTMAEGTPPQNGEDGAIEFLFNRQTSLKPKVNPNGSVDFKDVDLVVSAAKGQELARLKPPTKGAPGKNVRGEGIPCRDGVPANLPAGPGTGPRGDNPGVLVAAIDGNVRYNGTAVEICEGFVIKGNVDFSTGNIKYARSVIVGGDMPSGFKVECGGDLQVSGTIEDAEVIVGGNVLLKLGFVGQGKGIIDAKGDVNIGFMKNQIVKSQQNVVIAKEALNGTVFAKKTICVHGNPLSIAGGKMIARDSITAYSIGNNSGVKTVLEAGVDYILLEELEKTEAQLAQINENRKKLMTSINKYDRMVEHKMSLNAGDEALFKKLKTAIIKFDQQMKSLEDRKKTISLNVYDLKNAFILFEHGALPGAVFKIGTRIFNVKEEIAGRKTVRLVEDEIKVF